MLPRHENSLDQRLDLMSKNSSGVEIGHRKIAWLAGCALILGLSLTIGRIIVQYQTPGPFDPNNQGLCDFHNGIYFPTRALLNGISPYSQNYADTNPVARQIPFFSPLILLLHTPFVVVPLRVGEIAFVVFSIGVLMGIGFAVAAAIGKPKRIDVALSVSAFLIFTRGGHVTLFDGYFTLELILATILSVHWADKKKPWLAAVALAIVSAKPTYILPLGFLMLARGNLKPLILGAVISIVGAALPMGLLAYAVGDGNVSQGWQQLRSDIEEAQEFHMADDLETPTNTWTRVDALAIVAKWLQSDPSQAAHLIVMMVILAVPMFLLWQRFKASDDDGICGVCGGLLMTTLLVSLYHQAYDTMLLVAPLAGLVYQWGRWPELSGKAQFFIGALMLLPSVNIFSTRSLLLGLGLPPGAVRAATSINACSLVICLVITCLVVAKVGKAPCDRKN